jgi:hypothetical protein
VEDVDLYFALYILFVLCEITVQKIELFAFQALANIKIHKNSLREEKNVQHFPYISHKICVFMILRVDEIAQCVVLISRDLSKLSLNYNNSTRLFSSYNIHSKGVHI